MCLIAPELPGQQNFQQQRQQQQRQQQQRQQGRGQQQQQQGRERQERRSRQRTRRSSGPSGNNPFQQNQNARQGTPQRARPQARSQIRRRGQGRKTSTAGTVGDFPKYELSPIIETDTVYFSPAHITTEIGHRFSTPILFYNINANEIDRFEMWVRYDPELIDPVWVDAGDTGDLLAGELESEVWRVRGFIRLSGRYREIQDKKIQPVATIRWAAKEIGAPTEIHMEGPEGAEIGFYQGELNCLEQSRIGNDGLVSAQIVISGDRAREEDTFLELPAHADPYAPLERVGRGVHLALIPKDPAIYTGETSTVDVVLINPDMVALDEIRFRIRYDPGAVEVLDADEENYISEGVNIYDGGFHDRMPFEFHEKNGVDRIRGIIDYAALSGKGLRAYPTGTVARIVFRMKREAGSTYFWFEGLDPLTKRYLSDVRARTRSLLGPGSGREAEGLHNAVISVSPD